MFGEEDRIKAHRPRAQIIANLILICFGIVLARLWYLQIYKGDTLYQYSLQNRLRREIVRAPRGKIFSSNHKLLVDNVPRFDAILTPQYLQNENKTLDRLSKILDMSKDSIKTILQKNSTLPRYKSIIIKKDISREEVALIETEVHELPGIAVDTFISRQYFDEEVGAHLLGYISEISQKQLPKYRNRDDIDYILGDFIGQFGLEEQLDSSIRGNNGYEFVEVDAFGRKKRDINDSIFKGISNKPSVPGKNIRLTIDQDLQKSAFTALDNKVGSAVAIDVNSGKILAMVSRPSFEPSQFSRGLSSNYWNELVDNENNPLRDRTIQEHYAPGSTFKAITAIAALEEGIIDENTEVNCQGSFALGKRKYHCWKKWGHGKVKLRQAIRESCNIFFQKIGTKISIDTLSKYANLFGFGKKTGVSLPREIPGLMPTSSWKKKKYGIEWQLGETLSCAIGQSFVLATPLQIAMAYSAIANGGHLYRPYLVNEVFTNSGKVIKSNFTELVSKINVKEENLDLVREGLYDVVNSPKGTAWWHRGAGIQMAGKTGTSQVFRAKSESLYSKCDKLEYKLRHHGIFVGFAPFKNPKIAVVAVVEHGCSGSGAAAPVVEAITMTYMKKYHPQIFEENKKIDRVIFNKWLADKQATEIKKSEEVED